MQLSYPCSIADQVDAVVYPRPLPLRGLSLSLLQLQRFLQAWSVLPIDLLIDIGASASYNGARICEAEGFLGRSF